MTRKCGLLVQKNNNSEFAEIIANIITLNVIIT